MKDDEAATLATIIRHRDFVREAMSHVGNKLAHRALVHDESKLREDELAGFCRINRVARENEYGSPEYVESMRRERETIQLHYSRNSHHPEHHAQVGDMGALDIIEMVCDWWAASKAYGNAGFDEDFLQKQFDRFGFFPVQQWLIREIADELSGLDQEDMRCL